MYNCDDQSCLHIFLRSSNIWSFICSLAIVTILTKTPNKHLYALSFPLPYPSICVIRVSSQTQAVSVFKSSFTMVENLSVEPTLSLDPCEINSRTTGLNIQCHTFIRLSNVTNESISGGGDVGSCDTKKKQSLMFYWRYFALLDHLCQFNKSIQHLLITEVA